MKIQKKILILSTIMVITVLCAMVFTSCQPKEKLSKIEQIQKKGKIILGTSADYPPYEFHFLVNGKDTIVGFDVAIAEEIARDLGVSLEIKDMSFDGLLAALVSGNVDFVLSGMTPNEERRQNVDFSDIYYQATHGAVIRKADEAKYATSPDSLKNVMLGAQKGAIQVGIAKEQVKGVRGSDLNNNHPQIKELGALPDLIMEVKNAKIEAVIAELPVAKAYVARNPDLMIANYVFADSEGGSAVAIKKDNADFVNAVNKTLNRLAVEGKIDQFVGEANMLANELQSD